MQGDGSFITRQTSLTIIMDINMTAKIALAQFEIALGSPEKNLHIALTAIDQAAEQGCQLVQLPELWLSGYDLSNCERYSQLTAVWIQHLQALADSRKLAIGGTFITGQNQEYYNTYLLFQPGQPEPAGYNKTHLFRFLGEENYFSPGNHLTVVQLPWGKVGLAICYDLRFPELIRAYAERGIVCLLVSAEWGQKRAEHWRTLLKARAIENQIFVAATNGIGPIYENQLAGYSAVIDPWGNVLAEGGPDTPALLTANLDVAEIDQVRQIVPSTPDRRTSLYQQWFEEFHSDR
ncbi:MAG: carbon-nitrogen family hydrolase [Chloroflexi bacterium]|nr:MAG: carbon-nitrogen family hydrolase [Chloroflexota bacterium]